MITNKEYEEALQNQDNINIMNSVCSRFSQSLDYDDLYRCKLMGLWRALRFWKHDGGRKFTNFLYRSTYWSCLKALKQKSKHGNFSISTCNITTYDQTPFFEILDGLPHDLKDIMHKKYVDNMERVVYTSYNSCRIIGHGGPDV